MKMPMSKRAAAPATSVACTFTIAVSPTNEQPWITPFGRTCNVATVTSFAVQLSLRPVRSPSQVCADAAATSQPSIAVARMMRIDRRP